MPYDLTWSCYEPTVNGQVCKICGPCYMRRIAFEMNGSRDPLLDKETEEGVEQVAANSVAGER
jgi:7-cyano-7-deazaguanine synthase in queuosine biosynthesis